MVKKRKDCGLRALVSRSLFHPGSELVGPAELRKREHENETGGIWEEKGQGTGLSLPFFFLFPFSHPATFSRAFYFRVYPTFWGLGQATFLAASPLTSHACSHWGLFPARERNLAWCIRYSPPASVSMPTLKTALLLYCIVSICIVI